tara:strand:- start:172 stop:393 length:222 start_codon:yes stop_codon:yes gene_type:complete
MYKGVKMSDVEINDDLYNKWAEFKILIESLEQDILKNVKGNKSAGVRARKGLRLVKTTASDIVKTSLAHDKEK